MTEGRPDLAFNPDTPCVLCTTPFSDHGSRTHRFVGPNEDPGAAIKNPEKKKDQPKPAPATFHLLPAPDLVLRGLLLRKGVITTEELEVVERELTLGQSLSGEAPGIRTDAGSDGGDSTDRPAARPE